jgi:glycine oxidase
MPADVAVVGAGVIGLACAWQAARRGMAVTLVDPEPGRGASWVAAGMLAPVTEVHYGEEALLALNAASAARWERFAEDLVAATGRLVGYERCGTLLVAAEAGDRAWAQDLFRFQRELGLEVEWLTGRQARSLEPGLSPGISAAVWAPGDHQVHNRLLVDALIAAGAGAGVRTVLEPATAVELQGGRVAGVRLGSGRSVEAPVVVLAAGVATPGVTGLPAGAVPAVRPVKGQILRLAPRPGGPSLGRIVRGIVDGAAVYLVPRADGSLVVGATAEEQGHDTSVTAGAVYELLRDARRIVPGVAEMGLEEASAGLRPGSPDNGPIVGPAPGVNGLVLATGHFRNGILLAPITAEGVAAVVAGEGLPAELLPFGPGRFTEVSC